MLKPPPTLCFVAALPMWGCVAASNDNAVDWNKINYVEIVCGKGKSTNPGCKSDETLSSIGRGGKGR